MKEFLNNLYDILNTPIEQSPAQPFYTMFIVALSMFGVTSLIALISRTTVSSAPHEESYKIAIATNVIIVIWSMLSVCYALCCDQKLLSVAIILSIGILMSIVNIVIKSIIIKTEKIKKLRR